jgi:hypothetical protein
MYDGKAVIPLVMEYIPENEQTDSSKYRLMPFKGDEGLVEVGAVGTGCIIIHRRVLEAIQHPFENIYDEKGFKIEGNDLRFCTMARAKGFKVHCHLNYIAGHVASLDLRTLYKAFIDKEEIKAAKLS